MATRSVSIEKDLECPVCLDVFKNPKYLHCLHTFCETCINNVAHGGGLVVCPECRQETVLEPAKMASGLKPNIVVNRLVETLKFMKASREESLVSVDGELMCSNHRHYVRKYYCKRCRSLICSECSMKHHHDHASDVSLANIIVEERKSSIESFLENSEEEVRQIEDTRKAIEKRLQAKMKLLEGASAMKSRMDESFASIKYHTQTVFDQLKGVKLRQERLVNRRVNINQLGRNLLRSGNEEELITIYPEWSDAAEDLSAMQTSPESSLEVTEEGRLTGHLDSCLVYLEQLSVSLKELRLQIGLDVSHGLTEQASKLNIREKKETRRPSCSNNNNITNKTGTNGNQALRGPSTFESHVSNERRPFEQYSVAPQSRAMPLSSLDAPPVRSEVTPEEQLGTELAPPKWSEDESLWDTGSRDLDRSILKEYVMDGHNKGAARGPTPGSSSPASHSFSPTHAHSSGDRPALHHSASAPGSHTSAPAKRAQFSQGTMQDSFSPHPSSQPVDEEAQSSDAPPKWSEEDSFWGGSALTTRPQPQHPAPVSKHATTVPNMPHQTLISHPLGSMPSSGSNLPTAEGQTSSDAPPKWSEDDSMWGDTSPTSARPSLKHSSSAPEYPQAGPKLPSKTLPSTRPSLSHSVSVPEYPTNPTQSVHGDQQLNPAMYPGAGVIRYPGYSSSAAQQYQQGANIGPIFTGPLSPLPQVPYPHANTGINEEAPNPYQPPVLTYPSVVRTDIKPAPVRQRAPGKRPKRR